MKGICSLASHDLSLNLYYMYKLPDKSKSTIINFRDLFRLLQAFFRPLSFWILTTEVLHVVKTQALIFFLKIGVLMILQLENLTCMKEIGAYCSCSASFVIYSC